MTEAADYRNFIRLQVLMNQAGVTLREVFKKRWKNLKGEEWIDGRKSGSNFMNMFGNHIFCNKGQLSIQRKSVEMGDTNHWDISTLALILLQDDFRKLMTGKDEQNMMKQLKSIRNNLAHHPTQIISDTEFNKDWQQVADILLYFGCSQNTLDSIHLTENIGGIEFKSTKCVNSENDKLANQLRDDGNSAFKEGDTATALQLYTKAIVLPEISDHILAILYCNRIAVYLKKNDEKTQSSFMPDNVLQNAKEDAKKAIQLRPTWWKAYYRMGCVQQKYGNFKKAVHFFNQALGLDPTQQSVRLAKEHCQQNFEIQDRREHLDSLNTPLSIEEQIQKVNEERGLQLSKEMYDKQFKKLRKAGDPLADVWQAHKYKDGIDAPQNYELAAKLYAKAAGKGSAEGMYNLAILTKLGKGVKKDIHLAIQLFKQAAAQPLTQSHSTPNVGVAESEFALGLMYMDGLGFDYNPFEALTWYERSSLHGCGSAANNLAIMYNTGVGVEINLQRAVQYWKLAATRKVTSAMESLACHYLHDQQPLLAKEWFKRALENGSLTAQLHKDEFESKVKKLSEEVEKSDLVIWEREQGLTVGNLTLIERMLRMTQAKNPRLAEVLEGLSDVHAANLSSHLPCESGTKLRFEFSVIKKFVENGSITASIMQRAFMYFVEGLMLLESGNEDDAIKHFAECLRTEHITAQFPNDVVEKLKKILEKRLEDGDFKDRELNRDIHVCYCFLRANALEETIVLLKVLIKKFPNEICFYDLCAGLYGFLKKFEEANKIANEGVALFPDDCGLRFTKAASSRLMENGNRADSITAYEEFLKIAPVDHRKVPESYYGIATCYIEMMLNLMTSPKLDNKLVKMVKKYYQLGLVSEKKQLPFFLPYSSVSKSHVENVLQMIESGQVFQLSDENKENKKTKVEKSEKNFPVKSKIAKSSACSNISLMDPLRLEIIRAHREHFSSVRKIPKTAHSFSLAKKPKNKQIVPSQLIGLKAITLQEMDPTKDRVYDGFVLQVTSIEDAITGMASIALVIEDENGDTQRCCVYNFEQGQEVQEKLGYGCKISIINPYMRIALDGKPGIRIDDMASLFFHPEKEVNRCRFCGVGNALKKCSRCQRAVYCSKECQVQDWNIFCHKAICVKQLNLPFCSEYAELG